MSVAVNQINQSQLAAFVVSTMTGGNFSGMLGAYLAGGGSLNTGVLSTTGGAQSVATAVTFQLNPTVPYSGTTGQAPSLRLVQDKIQYYIDSLSGTMTGAYVTIVGNQSIADYKVFTGSVGVGAGTIGGHAATLAQLSGASGILNALISAGSVSLATLQATSGSLLDSIATSGQAAVAYTDGVSGALQAQIAGGGSQVKVSGSDNIATANFTGIGGVTVLYSGGTIFVSGITGGGGGAGDVTTAQFNALSGFVTGVSGFQGAQISALPTAAQLAQTGTTLDVKINSLSGHVDSVSGALQAQIAGANGTQVSVTGGGTMGFAALTGVGSVTVTSLGNTVIISGAAGGGAGDVTEAQLNSLSGYVDSVSGVLQTQITALPTAAQLAQTGTTLYVLATGLSGQAVLDYATIANLATTGTNVNNLLTGASGSLTTRDIDISGALQAQIAGANGTQVQVTGGGTMGFANFTGVGGVSVTSLGSVVTISGTAGGGGAGGTTTLARWTIQSNQPTATAYATFDTNNSIGVLNFDAVTGETGVFVNIIPQGATLTNGTETRLFFRAAGATTGAVVWNVAFESGNGNIASDGWTTGINSSGAPANGTLGYQTVATIFHGGGEIGGLSAGDFFRVRVSRVSLDAADTMTGDAQLTALEIRQR